MNKEELSERYRFKNRHQQCIKNCNCAIFELKIIDFADFLNDILPKCPEKNGCLNSFDRLKEYFEIAIKKNRLNEK